MNQNDLLKFLLEGEGCARAVELDAPKAKALSIDKAVRDGKILPSLSGRLDFDIAASGTWSMAKCVNYINALCIENRVRSSGATVPASRSTAALKNLFSMVIPARHATKVEVMRVIKSVIENWSEFEKYYPRAAEVGFSLPYWAKAWGKIEEFQNLSGGATLPESSSDRSLLSAHVRNDTNNKPGTSPIIIS